MKAQRAALIRGLLALFVALAPAGAQAQVIDDLLKQKRLEGERRKVEEATAAARSAAPIDVVGLTLGMNFAAAETIVRAHMKVDRVIAIQRPSILAADTKVQPYGSGLLFLNEGGTEGIALFNEAPAAPDRLVAVMRSIAQQPGSLPAAGFLETLRGKYGPELRLKAEDKKFDVVWTAGNDMRASAPTLQWCIDYADTSSPYDHPLTENGFERPLGRNKAGEWIMNNDPRMPLIQRGVIWNWPRTPRYFNTRDEDKRNYACLPTLLVGHNTFNNMDQANFSLVDHEAYLPLFRESERMLRSGATSGGRGADVKL